ncbi:divergent PAP2 family protein [Prochlorococcus sp. MIT 1307]|uniref:divergent PAP2 family protein n=1 Tax=Prochlorococcus sp. MIT 1307 TaxID=3096219 RepID=UPI002A75B908|nr:divergent PAP2 family protein [Prochlorococcus sp. MIT 1307]
MNHTSSLPALLQLFNNAVLAWGLLACGIAQASKLFVEFVQHRRWRPSVLLETGGMPSSHSAFVTGTASGVGLELGFDHPAFAIAATLAFVVMYDASGIRRAAGLTAERVNELPASNWPSPPASPLKESLGHTRREVFVGSLIGPAVSLPGIFFLGSPLHLFQTFGLLVG